VGGYVGEKMNFEMFGPEVRWAISVVDNQSRPHEIFVSTSVKNLIQSRSTDVTAEPKFRNLNARSGRTSDNNENVFVIDNIVSLGGQSQCGSNIRAAITKSDAAVNKGKSTEIDDFYCCRIWVDDYNSRLFSSIYESEALIEDPDLSPRISNQYCNQPSFNDDLVATDTTDGPSLSTGTSAVGVSLSGKEDISIKSQSLGTISQGTPAGGITSAATPTVAQYSRADFRSNLSVSSNVSNYTGYDQGPKLEDYFPVYDDARIKRSKLRSALQTRSPSLNEVSERGKSDRYSPPSGSQPSRMKRPFIAAQANSARRSFKSQGGSDAPMKNTVSLFEPLLLGLSGAIRFLRGINEFSVIKSPDSSWLNSYEDLYWPTDDITASLIEKEQLEHDVHELVFSQCFWQLFTLGISSDFYKLTLFFRNLPSIWEFRKFVFPSYLIGVFLSKFNFPKDQSDDIPDPFEVLYSLRLIPSDIASIFLGAMSSFRRLVGLLINGDDDVLDGSYQSATPKPDTCMDRVTSLLLRNAPIAPNKRSPATMKGIKNFGPTLGANSNADPALDVPSSSKLGPSAEGHEDEAHIQGVSITHPDRLATSPPDSDPTNEKWVKYSEAYRKNIFSGGLLLIWNIVSVTSLTFAVVLLISQSAYRETENEFLDYRYASVVFITLVIVVGEYIAFSSFVYIWVRKLFVVFDCVYMCSLLYRTFFQMLAGLFALLIFYPLVEFKDPSVMAPFNAGLEITPVEVMNAAALHLLVLHWALGRFDIHLLFFIISTSIF
jgi:hypothetical protein